MIDAETVDRAVLLLSTAVGEVVEDEHVAMVSPPRGHAAALAHAEQLEQLGGDVATLAAAISVLLRRREADEPA